MTAGAEAWSVPVMELYEAQWNRLVRVSALLIGDVSAAEDVVQEAFVKMAARRRRPQEEPIASQVAYVTAIVVNLSRSTLRRRSLARRYNERLAGARPAVEAGVDSSLLASRERELVIAALRRLPRRQREALVLRYYADLPLPVVAEVMGVSVGTVKSTLSRGGNALAELMGARP